MPHSNYEASDFTAGLEYFDYKYERTPDYDKTIDYIINKGKYPDQNKNEK